MSIEKMIKEKPVKVTNNGMITIPAAFRKRYNLNDGDKVLILEDAGMLKIVPIRDISELRKGSYSSEDMKVLSKKLKSEELKREL
ncbi:MAG: AbrB/MazE/SpoVT family DNA-binding domain-containing protein [Promethearchaeia archaeon]